jgi:HK97 family phage prohead protease
VIASPPIRIEKALGEGRFSGLAWSFLDTPDREGDVILPSALEAAVKSGRLPEIRIEHRTNEIAGSIAVMQVTNRGLEVEGQIDLTGNIGRKTYEQLRSRDLAALSIGFRGTAERSGKTRVFTEVELDEISIVREPMNAGARIAAVKSWDEVGSERDLERLLHDVVGMPNRLARKSAALVWPSLQKEPALDAAKADEIARRIRSITASLRNPK